MARTACPHCKGEMENASICKSCKNTLDKALLNIRDFWNALYSVRAKQVRFGSGNSGRSTETPIPIDARFGKGGSGALAIDLARNTVTTWTRYVLDNVSAQNEHPRDTIASCCDFLLRWTDWLRISDVGHEVLLDMLGLEETLRRLVDRPADRWYAGKCGLEGCDAELYAKSETGQVKCQGCGHMWDLSVRRKVLLEHAEAMLVTATEAARAVVVWSEYDGGESLLVNRIGKWAQRKRIETRGHVDVGGKERPMYLLRDILDLLADDLRHAVESRPA